MNLLGLVGELRPGRRDVAGRSWSSRFDIDRLARGDVVLEGKRLRRALDARTCRGLPTRTTWSRACSPFAPAGHRSAARGRRSAPALRGVHTLAEAVDLVACVTERAGASTRCPSWRRSAAATRSSCREHEARALVDELRRAGVPLREARLALTGRERGPELWAVLAALPRDEAIRRAA